MRCAADDRQALEQLCRYTTRPALANEGVQCNAAEQVVLKLKTPWRDGTTHLVMSPLGFMQWLAAMAPIVGGQPQRSSQGARSGDCFVATNSGQRVSLKGRQRV